MEFINENDLSYILNNIRILEKNFYEGNAPIGTMKMYTNYLKSNNFNFSFSEDKKIIIKDLDGAKIAQIQNPIYPNNSADGREITKNKIKTEQVLRTYGIRTTTSLVLKFSDLKKVKDKLTTNETPLVIKPLRSSLGTGVYVNVNKKNIDQYWDLCQKSKNYSVNDKIIIQQYLEGFEVRATVMEGNLVAVTIRIPPYVVGDGTKSIEQLIEDKNKKRLKCNFLKRYPIIKTERLIGFLRDNNKSVSYIPLKDECVLLSSVSNTSGGGELANITEYVSEDIKNIALDSIAALPGMFSGGIDIMIKSFEDTKPTVIEINSFPVLALAIYPTYGTSADPIKYFIESIISKYQVIMNINNRYANINEEKYIENYVDFIIRKKNIYLNKSLGSV